MPNTATLFLLAACASRHATPTPTQPADDLTKGPPAALVRRDLGCPAGDIVYTGGMGTPDQVVLRTLEACGTAATYVWGDASGWARRVD